MQIITKKLAELNPAPYNPRKITDDALEGFDDTARMAQDDTAEDDARPAYLTSAQTNEVLAAIEETLQEVQDA